MRSAFLRWLSRPAAPAAIVAIALLLVAPALGTGLTADDYFHELVLQHRGGIGAIPSDPLSMFVWANGDPAQAHAMMEVGMTGWWTDPDLRMAYLRPISVITHWLDQRLWPDAPWLAHLHSIAWFALALLFVRRVYARLMPAGAHGACAAGAALAWLPALALLLYAVDDAHGMTVAWIANRNALVAFALSLPVLLLHDRRRRDGDVRAGRAAPLVLVLALLAGESALAITGYLFAYALFVDPAPRRRALLRLWPYAVVAFLWAGCYRALGFGARGSGLVVDPGSEPLRYLAALAERVPALLSAQVGFPPSDLWEAYPFIASWLPPWMLLWAVLVVAGFVLAIWPVLRSEPRARFFALGALLSACPVSAQFPHDRLLLFVGFGAMPLVALLLARLWTGVRSAGLRGRFEQAVAYGCIGLHLVLAPLWLPLRVRAPLDSERMIGAADRSLDDSAAVRDKTLVLINPPMDAFAGYIPTMRAAQHRNRPRAVRWLATGGSDVRIERLDERTVRVRPEGGFLALPSERMQRNPNKPMPVGYRVQFSDLSIEVTALTPDGRPAEIVAHFAQPPESGHYEFYAWARKRYVPFALPPVGQTRVLPKVDFAALLP